MADDYGDFFKSAAEQATAAPAMPQDRLAAASAMAGAAEARLTPSAPAVASVPPDPYADFFKKVTAPQASAAQAVTAANVQSGITPAAAGQAAKTGQQLGLPQAVVETDPARFQSQAKAQTDADLLAQNPVLAQWVAANPAAARIAGDEYDKLSAIEKLGRGTADTAYAGLQALGSSFNQAALGLNRVLAPGPNSPFQLMRWAAMVPGAQEIYQREFLDPLERNQAALTLSPTAGIGEKAAAMAGNLLGMLSQITLTGGGGGEVLPATAGAVQTIQQAVATAARSMAFPSLTAATNTGHDVLAATNDPVQAAKAATATYLFSTLQGMVPFSAPGSLAQRLATGALSGAVTSEAQRSAMNLLMPESMQQPFDPKDLIFQALSGAVLGGVMGPRASQDAHLYEAVRSTYTEALRAEQAEREVGKVAALGEIASRTALRESAPDAFHEFVSAVTDKSQVDAVYVDGKKLAQAYAQSKLAAPDSIARQLTEAVTTGGDVRIPVADYATHLAGTEVGKAILPDMKVAPDGMTYAEGQRYFQEASQTLAAKAAEVGQQKQAASDLEADVASVHQGILADLAQTNRFPRDVNQAYASHLTNFYTTLAARWGVKPSEVRALYDLRTEAPTEPAKQPNVSAEKTATESQQFGPAATKDEHTAATVEMRKRQSVLASLMECMG